LLVSKYDIPAGRTHITVQDVVHLVELRDITAGTSCSCSQGGMGLVETLSPWVKYGLISGGALLLLSMLGRPGSAKYKRELADARDEYESRVRAIGRKYPRVGGRLRRAASAF